MASLSLDLQWKLLLNWVGEVECLLFYFSYFNILDHFQCDYSFSLEWSNHLIHKEGIYIHVENPNVKKKFTICAFLFDVFCSVYKQFEYRRIIKKFHNAKGATIIFFIQYHTSFSCNLINSYLVVIFVIDRVSVNVTSQCYITRYLSETKTCLL